MYISICAFRALNIHNLFFHVYLPYPSARLDSIPFSKHVPHLSRFVTECSLLLASRLFLLCLPTHTHSVFRYPGDSAMQLYLPMKAFLMPPDDEISAFCGPPWHFEACVRHCLCSTLHYKGSLVIFEKHKSHHATLWPKTLQTHHHIALAIKSGFLQEGLQV